MKPTHLSEVRAIADKALDNGASVTGPRSVGWNVASKCERPHRVTLEGRHSRRAGSPQWAHPAHQYSPQHPRFWKTQIATDRNSPVCMHNAPLWVDIDVGCRKCAACLRKRGVHWRERAKTEINAAERTWFGTLTFNPHERWLVECRAVRDLQALPDAERFTELHRCISPLLTNYVKRLRKDAKHRLRILCVAEAHKSGWPHYHMLVHEQHTGAVGERTLASQWTHGFSKWKVVKDSDRAASYCAKYLFKSSLARVRASGRYGNPALAVGLPNSECGQAVKGERGPQCPPKGPEAEKRMA